MLSGLKKYKRLNAKHQYNHIYHKSNSTGDSCSSAVVISIWAIADRQISFCGFS